MTFLPEDCYRITGFMPTISQAYKQKLLCLGLLPGTEFRVIRTAPFGDPIQIMVGYNQVVMRKKDIALLQLDKISLSSHKQSSNSNK